MKFGYNSTIGKKLKPCKSCGKPCYWFSKQRCSDCARVEDTMKRMEAESERVIEEEDLSGLIEDADIIMSRYIRLKYADKDGLVKCYTCDVKKHWSLMQAGHYVKRANLYLRWDERNLRPQESYCNEYLHGNMAEFTKRLDQECKGLPDILRADAVLVHKPTREEIRQIISEYTPKVKFLKSKLKT
jgi:ribosomal protein L37E